MDDKKAATILLGLLKRYPFTKTEEDAIRKAIGILSWTQLSSSRIKAMKNRREKDIK